MPRRAAVTGPGEWAVIAATYRNYGGAQKRAEAIREKFADCACTVHPPEGQGQYYYVVVASGLSKDGAEQMRRRAVSSGGPRDAYVTRMPTVSAAARP
jgi:hypothetical protein